MDEALRSRFPKACADFDSLTSAISRAKEESQSQDNIEALSLAYDSLLLEFPLCCDYWARYAHDMVCLHDYDKAVLVYERAIKVAPYSVGLWTSYCSFAMQLYKDSDDIRRLYERALSFVGKDYLCYLIWDKYIEFELSNNELVKLSHIYLRTLLFPSRKLHQYFERFKKLVSVLEEEMELQGYGVTEGIFDETLEFNTGEVAKMSEITHILVNEPNALFKPSMLKKYCLTGKYLYDKSCVLNRKIACYEIAIRRINFHMKSLDEGQLENWHCYLDIVEKAGDFDWIVKLYERCLIPCANYQEFWIRYAEHMEANGAREIAKCAIDRASKTYLKGDANFRLYCIRFMERIGDAIGFHSLYSWEFDSMPDFLHNVIRDANMEKRLGNIENAFQVYEKAILIAEERHDLQTLSLLYGHFANFKFVVTSSTDAARDIFYKGITKIPHNKYLMEALIQFFMLLGGPDDINALDSIISEALNYEGVASCALSVDDRVNISCMFIEFVDLYGTIHDVEKAWCRHRKLFPHLMKPVLELSNIHWKSNSVENKAEGSQSLVPPIICHIDDGLRSSQTNIPVQSHESDGNMDARVHNIFAKHEQIVCVDTEKKPSIGEVEFPTESDGLNGETNMVSAAFDNTLEISKVETEVRHQVLADTWKDIDPLTSKALRVNSPAAENRKFIMAKPDENEDHDHVMSKSPKSHGFPCMPSQTCDTEDVHIESSPLHGKAPELAGKEAPRSSCSVIPHESASYNVTTVSESLSVQTDVKTSAAITLMKESPQDSTIPDTQRYSHEEQPRQEKFQHQSEEQCTRGSIHSPQVSLVSSQNNQEKAVASAYACDSQAAHHVPKSSHQPSSEEYHYHQYQQQIPYQLWYSYQQQMYYAQLQQHKVQLQMQYMKTGQPAHFQQNPPHLQVSDGQGQSSQPPSLHQMAQQQYLPQQVLQNCQYQQYNQSSTQIQMAHHSQLSHQHCQPQMAQQLRVSQQPFDDHHLQLSQSQQQPPTYQLQQSHMLPLNQMRQDSGTYQLWYNQLTSSGDHIHGINNLQQPCTYGSNPQGEVGQQTMASEGLRESANTAQ